MKLWITFPPGLKSRRERCVNLSHDIQPGKRDGPRVCSTDWSPWLPFHKQVTIWPTQCWFLRYSAINFPMIYTSRCDHFRKQRFRKVKWPSQGHAGYSSSGQRSTHHAGQPSTIPPNQEENGGRAESKFRPKHLLEVNYGDYDPHTPCPKPKYSAETQPFQNFAPSENKIMALEFSKHLCIFHLLWLKINFPASKESQGTEDKEMRPWEFNCHQ